MNAVIEVGSYAGIVTALVLVTVHLVSQLRSPAPNAWLHRDRKPYQNEWRNVYRPIVAKREAQLLLEAAFEVPAQRRPVNDMDREGAA